MTIDPVFDAKFPTQNESSDMTDLAVVASEMLRQIQTKVLNGRYRSLAMTSLEECVMWANQGITHTKIRETPEENRR